jgi:hypothetical protein
MVDSGEPIDLVKIKCDSTDEDIDKSNGVTYSYLQDVPKDLSCRSPHRDFNLNFKSVAAAPTSLNVTDDIFREASAAPMAGGNLLGRLFSPDRLLVMLQGLRACEEHLKSLNTPIMSPTPSNDHSPTLDLSKPFPLAPTDLSLKPPPTPDSASDLSKVETEPQSQPLDFSPRRLDPVIGFAELQRKIWHAMATSTSPLPTHPLPSLNVPTLSPYSNPW